MSVQDVNKALGREETESFEATAESFAHFVALLSRAGVGDAANSHFRLAARACDAGAMQYEYLLRLEDLPRWLPCVAGGLGIDAFVWSGWHFNETDGAPRPSVCSTRIFLSVGLHPRRFVSRAERVPAASSAGGSAPPLLWNAAVSDEQRGRVQGCSSRRRSSRARGTAASRGRA